MKSFGELSRDGALRLAAGDYLGAVDLLEKAASIEPMNAAVRYDLAIALRGAGKTGLALEHAKCAASISPSDPDTRGCYGLILLELERIAEAEPELRAAIDLDPNRGEFQNNLGTLMFQRERYSEARTLFEKATRLSPESYDAWYNLRDVYEELGMDGEIEKCEKKLSELKKGKNGGSATK